MKNKKFNLIDAIALVVVLAVAVVVGVKFMGSDSTATVAPEMMAVSYVAMAEGVDARMYDTAKEHIPSSLMASGEVFDGQIVAVEKEPYLVLAANGEWVEDPTRVNLLFTVEANIAKTSVLSTEIAKQEIRIGRNTIIVKTEYIEFNSCIILDVNWGE